MRVQSYDFSVNWQRFSVFFCIFTLDLAISDMLEKTQGVVLHALRYSDDKEIVTVFTASRGAVSFMVKRPRGRGGTMVRVALMPLNLLEVDMDFREEVRLQRLVDVRVAEPYGSLPYNPMKQTIALFLGEFLYYALREEQASEELFEYLRMSLLWLDNRREGFANFPAVFLIHLSRFLGFWPDGEEAQVGLSEEERRLVPLMLRMDFGTMHLFRFSQGQRRRLLEVLNDYYRRHVPHFPELRSMAILREVLS